MDPSQFQTFTLGLAQQEAERREQLAMRELVKDLIKQTGTCDGTTTSGVCTWMREVTLALNQVGPELVQAASLSTWHRDRARGRYDMNLNVLFRM